MRIHSYASDKKAGSRQFALQLVAVSLPLVLAILVVISGIGNKEKEKDLSGNALVSEPSESQTSSETNNVCVIQGHIWKDADCTAPKTCTVCGETEGTPLNHEWNDATCTMAKTCIRCGATEGEPLGHDVPQLSCTEGGTCARCGEKIEALGHDWKEASCTEPKTCARCGETEGSELGHSTTNGVCSRCGNEVYETVSGSGDDVATNVSVGDGIYKVHFTNSGKSNFAVWIHYADGSRDLAANVIGDYDGYALLNGEGPYTFEIESKGKWTYTIEKIKLTGRSSFTGKGDFVTDEFVAYSGKWHLTHDGSSNFAVWLYTTDGRDLIVNEIGNYDGNRFLTFPGDGLGILVIEADGNWAIEPVEE